MKWSFLYYSIFVFYFIYLSYKYLFENILPNTYQSMICILCWIVVYSNKSKTN